MEITGSLNMKFSIAVLFFLALSSTGAVAAYAAGEASVLVRTAPLRQERVASSLTCYGVIAVDPRGTASITLPRSTRVSRLLATQGEVVAAGAPLVEVVTDSADTFNYEQATLSVDYARQELARTESMAAQRLATQSQLAAARKTLADAEAALREQSRLGTGRRRERLTAPFDGTVTAIAVKEGDSIPAGTALLQISRRGALRAELGVEPEDIARVRKGMEVALTTVFAGGKTLKGAVRDIHGVINPQTLLVDVIVSLAGKESESFLPGTQVRGVIRLSLQTGWVVPRQAVLRDGGGEYLYQVDRGRARRVNVVSSRAGNGLVAVRGQVNPGLKVVYLGNYELRDGMAVREENRR
jgi:RND family efflux transporter MFP subunit